MLCWASWSNNNKLANGWDRRSSGELVSHPFTLKSIPTYCNMCIRTYHCLNLSLPYNFYKLWNGLRHQEHPSKALHKGQVNPGGVPEKTGHSWQCIHRKLALDNFFNGMYQLSCHQGSVATLWRPKANIYVGYVLLAFPPQHFESNSQHGTTIPCGTVVEVVRKS